MESRPESRHRRSELLPSEEAYCEPSNRYTHEMSERFVEVAKFSSRLEAETVGHALDQFDIPFLVQSPDVGMFGPGMSGFTPQGASLMVPEDRRAEVAELLSCVVQPLDEAEEEGGPESDPDEETADPE